MKELAQENNQIKIEKHPYRERTRRHFKWNKNYTECARLPDIKYTFHLYLAKIGDNEYRITRADYEALRTIQAKARFIKDI